MNLNAPRQDVRECKHSSKPLSMEYEYARYRAAPQPYSFSYCSKPFERQDTQDAVKSQSIPIGKAALRRTASELKLSEDEATADFQDYVFFSRLLSGITKQQQESVSDKFLQESDECLAHIIGTRNGSLDNIHGSATASGYFFDDLDHHRSSRFQEEKDEGIFLMDM